jgi:hypothetical protein
MLAACRLAGLSALEGTIRASNGAQMAVDRPATDNAEARCKGAKPIATLPLQLGS